MPHWGWGKLTNGGIRICDCGEVTLEDEMHVCTLGDDMDNENPITQIQQQKDFTDIGKSAYLMLRGALDEGASLKEAIGVVAAWFEGMFRANAEDTDESETPSS